MHAQSVRELLIYPAVMTVSAPFYRPVRSRDAAWLAPYERCPALPAPPSPSPPRLSPAQSTHGRRDTDTAVPHPACRDTASAAGPEQFQSGRSGRTGWLSSLAMRRLMAHIGRITRSILLRTGTVGRARTSHCRERRFCSAWPPLGGCPNLPAPCAPSYLPPGYMSGESQPRLPP